MLSGYLPYVAAFFFLISATISFEFSKQVFEGQNEDLFRTRRRGLERTVFPTLLILMTLWSLTLMVSVAAISIFAFASGAVTAQHLNADLAP